MLSRFASPHFPVPLGVFRAVNDAHIYDTDVQKQVSEVTEKKGLGDMKKLLTSGDTWTVA